MAEITCDVNIDFYCAECGAPICHCVRQPDSRRAKVNVELCPVCKENYDKTIQDLEDKVRELEATIEGLTK